MFQKCPKCGCWCETVKSDALDRAIDGFANTANTTGNVGKSIGGLFGKTGGNIGKGLGYIVSGPQAMLSAVGEMLAGDSYKFCCQECGYSWSTDNVEDDQTAEYEVWLAEQKRNEDIIALREKYVSILHASDQVQEAYVNDILRYLANEQNTQNQKVTLYNCLAAAYRLTGEKGKALEAAETSLSLKDDDNMHILKGIIMGEGRNAQDTYSAMKEIVRYKLRGADESPFLTKAEIEECYLSLQSHYVQGFFSLPLAQRRYLAVCKELFCLPHSFCVLPLDELPTNIKFPVGHPKENTLYVCHPYRKDQYFPYDTYDIEILRDEIDEFCRIMEFLGAKHIDFKDTFEDSSEKNEQEKRNTHVKGEYKGHFSAAGGYESDTSHDAYERLSNELGRSKDFALVGRPMLPEGLVWYPHRKDWQHECDSRLSGRLVHSEFILSTTSSEVISESERKEIEADMNALIVSAKGHVEKTDSFKLKRESKRTWKVNVDFYPLADYEEKTPTPVDSIATKSKQNVFLSLFGNTKILSTIILLLLAIIAIIVFLHP